MASNKEDNAGLQPQAYEENVVGQSGKTTKSQNRGRGTSSRGSLPPGQSAKNFRATLKQTVQYLRPEKWRIAGVIVFTTLSVALNVSAPKFLGAATDQVFNGFISRMIAKMPQGQTPESCAIMMEKAGKAELSKMVCAVDVLPGQGIDWGSLRFYVLCALCVYIGSALALFLAGLLMRTVVQRVGYRLRAQINQKIDHLPLSYLDKQSRGDLLSRVTNDVDNLTQTLNNTLTHMFSSLLTVFGILTMMFWISWQLALVALVVMPLGGWGGKVIISKSEPHFITQWKATGDVSSTVEEAFTGAEVMQLYGLESEFTDRFNQNNSSLRHAAFKAQFISMCLQPMMSFISNLSYIAVAVLGGVMVSNGGLTIGGVQAFIQYSRQFAHPLGQIMQALNLLQSAMASAERIFELLGTKEMSPDPVSNPKWPARVRGDLDLRSVCFGYDAANPVIKELDLKVQSGQTLAIVGSTGAGKTTLINLLMRFYDIQSGQICIDSIDTSTVSRKDLRSQFGVVLQDTWLFKGSIRDNIALGKPTATDAEIQAAALAAGAHHMITTLPNGYDTQLEDNGQGLSGGEKQLITIARAFLSDPAILILDEATSAVDTRTEMLIGQGLSRLRQGRTGVVIAHRLSTIKQAEIILVMENGAVVERGNHDQLMKAKGAYYRLHNAQLRAEQDGI